MVMWLRESKAVGGDLSACIGIDSDIVRATDFATLVEADHALEAVRRACAKQLADAQAEAEALLDAARREADEYLEKAQAEYAAASGRGFEAGWQKVMTDCHLRRLQADRTAQPLALRQRERLAEIVALGVERIVGDAAPTERLRRAAEAIDGIVGEGSPVKVAVHPDDLAAATVAFNDAARVWREAGRSVRLQLSAEAQVEIGFCVCETDLGAIDMSLSAQLSAMRAALAAALDRASPVGEAA